MRKADIPYQTGNHGLVASATLYTTFLNYRQFSVFRLVLVHHTLLNLIHDKLFVDRLQNYLGLNEFIYGQSYTGNFNSVKKL